MSTLSKLSEKCKKCSMFEICNNKRMEAETYMAKNPNNLIEKCSAPLANQAMVSVVRIRNPITIKLGDYGSINTSMEEIREKIERQFLKSMSQMQK